MTGHGVRIRYALSTDYTGIDHLLKAAFPSIEEAHLVHTLRQDGDVAQEFVAIDGHGGLAGHLLFSRLIKPEQCLALAPLAVMPSHQKQGIGSALVRHGLQSIKATHKAVAVFLLGDPTYYQRFGFSLEEAERFHTPYPKEYFMALVLNQVCFQKLPSEVIYAAAFSGSR